MEIHITDSSFGNYLKSPSYPSLALFQSEIRNAPVGRRSTMGIHKCIMKKDYEGLKRILGSKKRETINDMDYFGRTAFHVALQMADPKALYLLLYYPLVHPSKLFATLDWDHILYDSVDHASVVCEAEVDISTDDHTSKSEPESSKELKEDTTVREEKLISSAQPRVGTNTPNFLSALIEQGKKKRSTESVKRPLMDDSISAAKIGANIIRYWEENPNHYIRAVLGTDFGNSILWCGLKEVEAFYEAHYKFLVGESYNLGHEVKEYAAKYPKLFAKHPSNIRTVANLNDVTSEGIHTRISIQTKCHNNRRTTTVSTYKSPLEDPTTGSEEPVAINGAHKNKIQKRNLSVIKDVFSVVRESKNKDTAKNGTSGKEGSGSGSNYKGRFNVANLLSTHSRGDNGPYIPLITCDMVATFDKTSPINILFSNIYTESSRENILKCLRILLHYFNKFSDCLEGYDLSDDTVFRYNRVLNQLDLSLRSSFLIPGSPAEETSSLPRDPLVTNAAKPDAKRLQRFCLSSLGKPSGRRVGNPGGMLSETNDEDTPSVRQHKMVRNFVDACEAVMKTESIVFKVNTESVDIPDEPLGALCKSVGFTSGSRTSSRNNSLRSQGIEASKKRVELTESIMADVEIDIIDLTDEPIGDLLHGPSANEITIDSDSEDAENKTSNDANVNMVPCVSQTLCADTNNMNKDVLNRATNAIGGFRYGKQRRTHQKCFQIPKKQLQIGSTRTSVLIPRQDDKSLVINDLILSSINWLRPTRTWDTFVNKRDYSRSNILHKVCQIRDVEMIKLLLQCGCMPLVVNEVGDMPVHLAMDAKEPICFITMLDATMKALFYHKFELVGLYNKSVKDENTWTNDINNGKGNKLTPFARYMNAVNSHLHQTMVMRAGCVHEAVSEFTKSVQSMSSLDMAGGTDVKAPLPKMSKLKWPDIGLNLNERKALLEEMILLIEQLTYRGIKAEAWEAMVVMFSYNEAISYHLLSNPHYMHRFFNMAAMIGNSEDFLSTVNYVVSSLFKTDVQTKNGENNDQIRLYPAEATGIRRVPAGNEPFTNVQHNKDKTELQTPPKTSQGGYITIRSCGFPSMPLKRIKTNDCNRTQAIEFKTNNPPIVSQPCPKAVLLKYRANVSSPPAPTENQRTWIITHPTCLHHLALPEPTDAPQKRHRLIMTYPENPTRLEVIISNENGILRSDTLDNVKLLHSPPPATLADILRVHDWGYVNKLLRQVQLAQKRWQTNAYWPLLTDGDTPTTPHSWNSALYAAGAVLAAVDAVCNNNCRNAFCAVRPPGHHLGTWGGAQSPNFEDEDFAAGSQGFCLINNVAIGAAYAKYMYANKGIRKVAIVDFDIHHGNGTDQIVQNIGPRSVKCKGASAANNANDNPAGHHLWFGWRDVNDREEVFFSSIHAYDGLFYPGTGKSCTKYEDSDPRIINVAVPDGTTSPEFRVLFESKILPYLLHFKPDLIFLSAGFDGHYRDSVSSGFTKYTEKDFYWATERLVAVANAVCNGRIVSVLEGGYNTRLDTLSPFARSVFEHVKALSSTPESSLYPFMHCESTLDFLISPIVGLDVKSGLVNAESVLGSAAICSFRMKEAIDKLLQKAYQIKKDCLCIVPRYHPVVPASIANMEALAQTDNCFYSFYSKNFWSYFMRWSTLWAIEKDRKMCHCRHPIQQRVIAFEKLLGIDLSGPPLIGSLVSYVGTTPTPSKLLGGCTTTSGPNELQKDNKKILYANPWAADIKIKSLERRATAAALLLEYFKKHEMHFTLSCEIH